MLDREAVGRAGQITVTLIATDEGTPSRTGVATCNIIVQGVNDNLPYFRQNQQNVSVFVMEGHIEKDIFQSVVSVLVEIHAHRACVCVLY